MRLLVVSKLAPANLYVVNRVLGEWPDAEVIRPYWVARSRNGPAWRRIRAAPVSGTLKALQRLSYGAYDRHVDRVVSRELFGSPEPPPVVLECRDVPAGALNSAEGVELIRSLRPDVLVLSGAPILGNDVLGVPRGGVVNVHFGISPHYRGSHTLFYALYREDYLRVGITLHFVDRGVDTGNIVAQGFPQLGPKDTEATVQAKCAKLASDLLIEFLRAYASSPTAGVPQSERGHLYRYRDRTLRQDAHHLWRRTALRRRPAPREARVVRYF